MRTVLVLVSGIILLSSIVYGKGPEPAGSLEEAAAFDFPPVPPGLSHRDYFHPYVGKALHRLVDLVYLKEYELANEHWERIRIYQKKYSEQLTPGMFHTLLWRIGYGYQKRGAQEVSAYMYSRALEMIAPMAFEQTDDVGDFSEHRYNEYFTLNNNATEASVKAGWIGQAKKLNQEAAAFLRRGFQVDVDSKFMSVNSRSYDGSVKPLNYAFTSYLTTRGVLSYNLGDIWDAEFTSRWALKIWQAHVPRQKVRLERGYNRDHYSQDIAAVDSYSQLRRLYDLLRYDEMAIDVCKAMAMQQRLNLHYQGTAMIQNERELIVRNARKHGFTPQTLEKFLAVQLPPAPDSDKPPRDPDAYTISEWAAKAEILWSIQRRNEAIAIFEDQRVMVLQTTDRQAWADLLLTYIRLRVASGSSESSVEDDLIHLLTYYRDRGIKPGEFDLYWYYAQWLINTGDMDAALIMLSHAYQIAEFLQAPSLIQLAENEQQKLLALSSKPSSETGSPPPSRTGGNEPQVDAPLMTNPLVAPQAPQANELLSDLQPLTLEVSTAAQEIARARFSLTSLSANPQSGQLMFTLPVGSEIAFLEDQYEIWIRPGTSATQEQVSLPLDVVPQSQWLIYVVVTPETKPEDARFTLYWRTAQGELKSSALFVDSAQQSVIHSVHRNWGLRNPFYAVPFYHEFYVQHPIPSHLNTRVIASQPSRVEYIHPGTFELLGVDDNGDGDFTDSGDVIYVDEDGSGHPEITLDPDQGLGVFEFQVFGQNERTQSITLEIQVFYPDQGWVPLALDELRGELQPGPEGSE